jgi:hypothetical protein
VILLLDIHSLGVAAIGSVVLHEGLEFIVPSKLDRQLGSDHILAQKQNSPSS